MESIIIVDDSNDWRALIVQLLREVRLEVLEAGTVTQALRLLHKPRPALVLINVSMTGRQGVEVLAAARNLPHFSLLTLLVYSSQGDAEAIRTAVKSGACGGISSKPLDPEDVVMQVRQHMRRSQFYVDPVPASPFEPPPPFAFRLTSITGESTDWLSYRHVEFHGTEMHVELACRYHLPFEVGEKLTFETRFCYATAVLGRFHSNGTLVLTLLQGSSRLQELLENSWD